MQQKKYTTRVSLKNILEILTDDDFVWIHRSCVVAADKIDQLTGTKVVINDQELPVRSLDFVANRKLPTKVRDAIFFTAYRIPPKGNRQVGSSATELKIGAEWRQKPRFETQ